MPAPPPEIPALWLAIGFLGQAVFMGRFVVQWIASERAGRSVVPVAFWILSIAGSWLLLAYAIYRRDPVIILGQAFGVVVYGRNLVLLRRHAGAAAAAEARASEVVPLRDEDRQTLRRAG